MDSRTFGRSTIDLPVLDSPDISLSPVSSLEGGRGGVQGFRYGEVRLRELDLADVRLVTGRISGLVAERVRFEEVGMDSVELDGCDLGGLGWSGGRLSRVVFRGCKLMGAAFGQLRLDSVLFEDCKLDYASFDQVRAGGALGFVRCSLREAAFERCDLSGVHVEGCDLRLTEFGGGTYRDADLRGNDLAEVRGVCALSGVIIDRPQQSELGHALMAELGIVFGDTLG
ncbi:pentapeptide repeat-containing protein [Streptomyces sp. SBT349]|uniref:pentapeptide repeat-containing protein n=1 Tax=Streptomyces sp. SBT349 TaxID=1580539 RepID=UPI00066DD7B5|nr:pentapeptide repeat-containing protein [Streptomyces sp. SBT349]